MKCINCKSDKIIKGLQPIDRGDHSVVRPFSIEIVKNPDATFFKGQTDIPLFAHICKNCGYVMFQLSKEELDLVNEIDDQKKNL